MKLSDFLDNKVVTTNLRAMDKCNALKEMIKILRKSGRTRDPDTVLKTLLEHANPFTGDSNLYRQSPLLFPSKGKGASNYLKSPPAP